VLDKGTVCMYNFFVAVDLNIEPRKIYSWPDFKKQKPSYSIALDGFVDSATIRDPEGPYANFDHHSKTDRLATRSTSEQVHIEIKLGLFDTFRRDGIPEAHIYVNDPDEDACLAWWLLKNNERVRNFSDLRINRLVYCEDRLDCTAGAYPFGDTSMRRKIAWIFQPYHEARFNGGVARMEGAEMRGIFESVEARISSHVSGDDSELKLEGNYERIGGGSGWTFTKETGSASRMAMYNDGITAFAALVAGKPDGSFIYTLGRRSVWTQFNLQELYSVLNEAEPDIVNDGNKWGGSDTIGGSPRETGSRLSPSRLQEIINSTLNGDRPV
jgi:hypothetical protein